MPRDPGLFLARRLGLGLRIGEDSPPDPRAWAMDQLRQVPPLDFIGPDGGSLRSRLPEYAEPLVDFEQACRVWEVYKVANTKLQKQSGKLSGGEFDLPMLLAILPQIILSIALFPLISRLVARLDRLRLTRFRVVN